ncbi:type II toxin-antitoxin system VapC family toxin [Methylotenera sp.]|uniref:type II toxin-antitoxin system VapC family toxin n=1 Tax=Methylotenera sp. TaxID=2051956 RepID=UPI002716F073|nr:type II toxin-antitoxin system VapC family toxin [Methylotenera sp.]MDO9204838.1 type II toxin-antitoxin system VapC family toxin [Methylotenera sp.]MDP2071923.1 type II toxin-antitoxin system VapC family toxin [Methylotenera sp.]MDP2230738.1 type II toxin-antitoxin system VapC family toxin [Methylotenera sp.]MDP3005548.1 type II toxin-antitoxin system VapC family toxin [Methylotenera sp.]MDP3140705.1 type II toxin-antitoxin system VapC family toxin [Methylotenera sp.]
MIRLLDTNACIQLWQRKNLNARRHLAQHCPADIALCSVVKAELLFGALRSEQKENNLHLLQKLFAPLQSFDFDDVAAEHYAQIRADLTAQGSLIGANDLMIAAIARANQVTLITHNTGEFSRVQGLLLEDWEL